MLREERGGVRVPSDNQQDRHAEVRVFRIHIRPEADPQKSFAYCLKEGVLGVGWRVGVPQGTRLSWEQYEALALAEYKDVPVVRNLYKNVRQGDLLWTRDHEGKYYLARAKGGWEYRATTEGYDVDVVNVIPCDIIGPLQPRDIPGGLINHFRAPLALQRITNPVLVAYTKLLWNKLSRMQVFTVPQFTVTDIFDFMDDLTLEDLVFLYLQMKGWLIYANSRRADTMRYELVLVHRDSKERAIVQVKGGRTPLADSDYIEYVEKGTVNKVFLFQAHGIYQGDGHPGVCRIQRDDLLQFMLDHKELLPGSAQHWLDFVSNRAELASR